MKLSIAIPDSCLNDEHTNLDKSRKIASIARACAVFQIETIYIYQHDSDSNDKTLLLTILKYLDTPQFLRKRLFPKMNELKYAGVLHPLKIPSHITLADAKKIKNGTHRDGIIVKTRGQIFADFGINMLLSYRGNLGIGKRITARFSSGAPDYKYKQVTKEETAQYWGYIVKERGPLAKLLSSWEDAIILTSRKGKIITQEQIKNYQSADGRLLVVYGSTEKGIHEILGKNLNNIPNSRVLNFFPNQATETVRLEEAILGTLAMLNLP